MCPGGEESGSVMGSMEQDAGATPGTHNQPARRRRYGIDISLTDGLAPNVVHDVGAEGVNVFSDGRLRNDLGQYLSARDVRESITTLRRYPRAQSQAQLRKRAYLIMAEDIPSKTLYQLDALNVEGILGQARFGVRFKGTYDTYGRLNLDIPNRKEISGRYARGLAVSLVEGNIKKGCFTAKAEITALDVQAIAHGALGKKGGGACAGAYAALLKGEAAIGLETSYMKVTISGNAYLGGLGASANGLLGKSKTGLYRLQFDAGRVFGTGFRLRCRVELGEKPSQALDKLLAKLPNGQKLFLAIQPDQLYAEGLQQFNQQRMSGLYRQASDAGLDEADFNLQDHQLSSGRKLNLLFTNENDFVLYHGRTANILFFSRAGINRGNIPIILSTPILNGYAPFSFRFTPQDFSFDRFLAFNDGQGLGLPTSQLFSYKRLMLGMGDEFLNQNPFEKNGIPNPYMHFSESEAKAVVDQLERYCRPRTLLEDIKALEWDFGKIKVIPARNIKVDNGHSIEIGITLEIIDGILTINPYAKIGVAAVIALTTMAINHHKKQRAQKAEDAYNKGIKPINDALDAINVKTTNLNSLYNKMVDALLKNEVDTYQGLYNKVQALKSELIQDISSHNAQLVAFRQHRPHDAYKNWDDTVNTVLKPAMANDDRLRDQIKALGLDITTAEFEAAYQFVSKHPNKSEYYDQAITVLRYVYQKLVNNTFDQDCIKGVKILLNNAFIHNKVQGNLENVFMIAMNALTTQKNLNSEDWRMVVENGMRYYQDAKSLSDIDRDGMAMLGKLASRLSNSETLDDDHYQFYTFLMKEDAGEVLWPTVLGIHHQAQEDWSGLIAIIKPWLEKNEDGFLRTALSNAYYKTKNYQLAIDAVEQKQENDRSHSDIKCYLLSKQQLMSQENGYADEIYNIAIKYAASREVFDADYFRIAMRVLEIDVNDEVCQSRWAHFYDLLDDFDSKQNTHQAVDQTAETEEALATKKAFAQFNQDEIILLKAHAKMGVHQYEEANTLLDTLSEAGVQQNSNEAHFLRSKIAYEQKDFNRAQAHVKLLTGEEVQASDIIIYRAQIYMNLKQPEDAWGILRALSSEHAEDPQVLEIKKQVCFSRGGNAINDAFDYHAKLPETPEMLQEGAILGMRYDRGLEAQKYIDKLKTHANQYKGDQKFQTVLNNLEAGFQYWRGYFCFELAQLMAPMVYQLCNVDPRNAILYDILLEAGSQTTFQFFLNKFNAESERVFASTEMNRPGMDRIQAATLGAFAIKQIFYLLQMDLSKPYQQSYLSYVIDNERFTALRQYQTWIGTVGFAADVTQFGLGLATFPYPALDSVSQITPEMCQISAQNMAYAGVALLAKGLDIFDQWYLENTGEYNENEGLNFSKALLKSISENRLLSMYMFYQRIQYFTHRFPGNAELVTKMLQSQFQMSDVDWIVQPVILAAEVGVGYVISKATLNVLKAGFEKQFASATSSIGSFVTKHAFKLKMGFWGLVVASIVRDTIITWRKISLDKKHRNVMILMSKAEYLAAFTKINQMAKDVPNLPADRTWWDWIWDLGADTTPEHVTHKVLALHLLFTLRKLGCFIGAGTDFNQYVKALKKRHCFDSQAPKTWTETTLLTEYSPKHDNIETLIADLNRFFNENFFDSTSYMDEDGNSRNSIKDMGIILFKDAMVEKYHKRSCESTTLCNPDFLKVIDVLDQHHDPDQRACGKSQLLSKLGELEAAGAQLKRVSSKQIDKSEWPPACLDASMTLDHWWNRVTMFWVDMSLRLVRKMSQSLSQRLPENHRLHRRLVLMSHGISGIRELFVMCQLSQIMAPEKFRQMMPWVYMRLSNIILDSALLFFKNVVAVGLLKSTKLSLNIVSAIFLLQQFKTVLESGELEPIALQTLILTTQIQSIMSDFLSLISIRQEYPNNRFILRVRLWLETYLNALYSSHVMMVSGAFLSARQFTMIDYPDYQSVLKVSAKLSWIKNLSQHANTHVRIVFTFLLGLAYQGYLSLQQAMDGNVSMADKDEMVFTQFFSQTSEFFEAVFKMLQDLFNDETVTSILFYGLVIMFFMKIIKAYFYSNVESTNRYHLITDYDDIKTALESERYDDAYQLILECEQKYSNIEQQQMGLLQFKSVALLYKSEPELLNAFDAILEFMKNAKKLQSAESDWPDEFSCTQLMEISMRLSVNETGTAKCLRDKLMIASKYCEVFLSKHLEHDAMHCQRIQLILKQYQYSPLLSIINMKLMIKKLKRSCDVLENIQQTVSNPILRGLSFKQVPGDGHCLFHVIGIVLSEDQATVRSMVASYLESNPNEFEEIIVASGLTRAEYIRRVRETNEYGDHIEIEIIQRITMRPIIIIRPDANPNMPDDFTIYSGEPIFLYFNGRTDLLAHYDAFIIQDDCDARGILRNIQAAMRGGQNVQYSPMTQFATVLEQALLCVAKLEETLNERQRFSYGHERLFQPAQPQTASNTDDFGLRHRKVNECHYGNLPLK